VTKFIKIFSIVLKSIFGLAVGLTILLFFYSAIFYNTSNDKQSLENESVKIEETADSAEAQTDQINENNSGGTKNLNNETESQVKEVVENDNVRDDSENIKSEIANEIRDGLFVVIGNKAITKLDIVNEIKIILILNNLSYSNDKRDELQQMAIKSAVKRSIKEIEIKKYGVLEYNKDEFYNNLNRLASRLNMDLEVLKNVCVSNGLDFAIIEEQIKTELLWNTLMYNLYQNIISINLGEIDEQLKLSQNKKEIKKYLISEIVINSIDKDKFESEIQEIKNKIETDGFESVAINSSISQTALQGGDLGWLSEHEISKKFRSTIFNTPVGNVSEPILIKEGILLFKVRDKKVTKNDINLEDLKNQLVNAEKTKILNMFAISHYDKARRATSIRFFNE